MNPPHRNDGLLPAGHSEQLPASLGRSVPDERHELPGKGVLAGQSAIGCFAIAVGTRHIGVLHKDEPAGLEASWQTPANLPSRPDRMPLHSPTTMAAGPPVCSITPGCVTWAKMYEAPPATRSGPAVAASFSSLSIPF
jgi:hypothetical protein